MFTRELDDFIETMGMPHGGMLSCEPLVAQSIVFHAIDYARSLGFEPHRDFQAALFGPRPAELLNTPWCVPERPIYVPGPHDNVFAITSKLTNALSADGFDYVDLLSLPGDDDDEGVDDDTVAGEENDLVHSPLERTVSSRE
jgi:hypothetical protein